MADIKIVDENGKEVTPEIPKSNNEPEMTLVPTGVFLAEQIAKLFDLKPNEVSQYKAKLNTLIDYAKTKTDNHSPESLKWVLRRLSTKLGTPTLGEKPITYLSRFAHLELESHRIEQEKRNFIDANNNN